MDDVVTCKKHNQIVDAATFQVKEGISGLTGKAGLSWDYWVTDGMQCQIIGQNTEGWIKGKIKVCFEFIPDEPITPKAPAESPLDDLRNR